MKTMLKKLIAISLACLMLLALVSCDKSSAVKKAFEKEEYTVTSVDANNDTAKGVLKLFGFTDEQMEKIGEYEIILCQKSLNVAVVIKFPKAADLEGFLTIEKDGKKDTALYDKAKEENKINGNCLLITISPDAKSVFEKA